MTSSLKAILPVASFSARNTCVVTVVSLTLCICDASIFTAFGSAVGLASAVVGGGVEALLRILVAARAMIMTMAAKIRINITADGQSLWRRGWFIVSVGSASTAAVSVSAARGSTPVSAHSLTVVGSISP